MKYTVTITETTDRYDDYTWTIETDEDGATCPSCGSITATLHNRHCLDCRNTSASAGEIDMPGTRAYALTYGETVTNLGETR